MATALETALRERLQNHLRDMLALRDRNVDPHTKVPRMNFVIKEYLDPITRQCPTKYLVQIRGVAIVDVKVRGKSLRQDFNNQLDKMVQELRPTALEWMPVIADPYGQASEPALVFHIFLPSDIQRPPTPEIYFETRVWHPNIRWDNGHTCYGNRQEWTDPTKSLADLVRRVYTMIAYLGHGAVNIQAADLLNEAAAQWYARLAEEGLGIFPLAKRTLV